MTATENAGALPKTEPASIARRPATPGDRGRQYGDGPSASSKPPELAQDASSSAIAPSMAQEGRDSISKTKNYAFGSGSTEEPNTHKDRGGPHNDISSAPNKPSGPTQVAPVNATNRAPPTPRVQHDPPSSGPTPARIKSDSGAAGKPASREVRGQSGGGTVTARPAASAQNASSHSPGNTQGVPPEVSHQIQGAPSRTPDTTSGAPRDAKALPSSQGQRNSATNNQNHQMSAEQQTIRTDGDQSRVAPPSSRTSGPRQDAHSDARASPTVRNQLNPANNSRTPNPPKSDHNNTNVQPTAREGGSGHRSGISSSPKPPGLSQGATNFSYASRVIQDALQSNITPSRDSFPALKPESNDSTEKRATRPDREQARSASWGPNSSVPASVKSAVNRGSHATIRTPPMGNSQHNPAAGGRSHPPPKPDVANTTGNSSARGDEGERRASTPSTPGSLPATQGVPSGHTQGGPVDVGMQPVLPDQPSSIPSGPAHSSQVPASINSAEKPVAQEGGSNGRADSPSAPRPLRPTRDTPGSGDGRMHSRPNNQRNTAHNSQPRTIGSGGQGHSSQPHSKSYAELQDEVYRLRSRVQHMEKRAAEELARFNDQLRASSNTIADLKEQETKLRQAHSFLTSDDRCSATDVKGYVEALNYEIQQVATDAAQYLGEKIHGSDKMVPDEGRPGVVELVKKTVGERLCRELGAWDHKKDFTLLQLALQAILCQSCKRFIELWDDGVFSGLSDHLANIYQTMKTTEPQSVLAQWRALTQRQVNSILDGEHSQSRFTPSLIAEILQVADVSNIHHADLRSLLTSALSEKLQSIESRMRLIKKAVTLEFISGDFELVFVCPGKTFDETYMKDTSGPSKDAGLTQVACTTDLGLRLIKKVTKGEETVHESSNSLAAQVLLESSIDEFLQ